MTGAATAVTAAAAALDDARRAALESCPANLLRTDCGLAVDQGQQINSD